MNSTDMETTQYVYMADTIENISSLCSELKELGFDVSNDETGIIVSNADYDMESIIDALDEYGVYYSFESGKDAAREKMCGIIKNLLDEINIGIVNIGNEYCLCDFEALYNDGPFLLDNEPVKYTSLPEIMDNSIVKARIDDSVYQLLKQELEQDNYEIGEDDFPETAVQWQNEVFSSYDYNVFKQNRPEADILTRIIANRVQLPLEELTTDEISMEQIYQLREAVNRSPDIKMSKNDNDILKSSERA